MRIKKGFTLAEILIVLMVISVIATMTIPGLLKGVKEAQYKTAYKKGYNMIVNVMATASIDGTLPARAGQISEYYKILAKNLEVKTFTYNIPVNLATAVATNDDNVKAGVNIKGKSFGVECELAANKDSCVNSGTDIAATGMSSDGTQNVLWLTTEDNISYAVVGGSINGTDGDITNSPICGTKQQIIATPSSSQQGEGSCAIVIVDTNSIFKTPNLVQQNTETFSSTANSGANLIATQVLADSDVSTPQLINDQFPVYIGRDGATAGDPKTMITGRLVGDIR